MQIKENKKNTKIYPCPCCGIAFITGEQKVCSECYDIMNNPKRKNERKDLFTLSLLR